MKQPKKEPKIRNGSALLVEDRAKARVLLGKSRKKKPHRGWILPGGGIHLFEGMKRAGAREMHEETGLRVKVGSLIGVYELISRRKKEHRIIVVHRARRISGKLGPSDELVEVGWFSRQQLKRLKITPKCKKMLRDAGWL